LFVNSIEKAADIKKHMEKGNRDIDCDLETIMKKDIEKFYQKRQNKIDDENDRILQERINLYVADKKKKIGASMKSAILGIKSNKTAEDEKIL